MKGKDVSVSAELQTWDSRRTGSITAEGAVGSGLNSGNVPELFCSNNREGTEKTCSGRETPDDKVALAPASAAGTIKGFKHL